MLAAGLKGIEEGYDLPAGGHRQRVRAHRRRAGRGGHRSSCRSRWPRRSTPWRAPSWCAETLGEHIFEWFLRNKRKEWADYKAQVTPFELDRYLPTW